MTILVTGAAGFIGGHLRSSLLRDGVAVTGLARRCPVDIGWRVGDLADASSMLVACSGMNTVIHCAGHAHAFAALHQADVGLHWQVNFEGTQRLVHMAGQAGVRRFVFLSSVKAMAEPGDQCADENLPGKPETAYGQSKLAAEQAVISAGGRYGMHVVNLRLAMVYGAGGRGNLERMGRLVARGLFPPLPETGNHRSLVHVDDVVSAMRVVAADDRANGRTYIVVGREAPSGRALYDALRQVQGLPPCRWTVPTVALRLAAKTGDGLEKLLGRRLPLDSEALDRLLGSAWYSPARIERELGWKARVSLLDGLSEMLGK